MCGVPGLGPANDVQEIATYAHARHIATYACPDNVNEEAGQASVSRSGPQGSVGGSLQHSTCATHVEMHSKSD